MDKYIIVIMLLVLAYTLFIYNLIDNVDKRMEIKEERFKNLLDFYVNKLQREQIHNLEISERENKKVIKSMIEHKEIKGRIGCFKERGFEYPVIPILYTEDILNVGEVVKVGERYLEITGIAFLSNEENQYEFDYIA